MGDILFLAHRIPYPPDRGDKIRSWHLLKHLSGLARCHLACFADDEADAAHLPALREALGGRLGQAHVEVRRVSRPLAALRALAGRKPLSLALFDGPALAGFVRRLVAGGGIDAVFAFSGQMARFVPAGPRFVMDFVDVDSAKFANYARTGPLPLRWIHAREARLLAAFERDVAARADAGLFVSEAEADLFRARARLPGADIRALSNGIDVDHFHPSVAPAAVPGEGPLIVFTGQMDYRPNVEAAAHFARAVLPRLRQARFAVVGRDPAPAVRALAGERVIVTGAVPDVRPWIAAADVVAAPLGIARGIQNKVLEAMAMGRPVVASSAAFEGIEARPGAELVVADGDAAQASAIAALLADPARAAAIGAAARLRMERSYRWEARLAPLAALIGRAAPRAAA